MTERLNDVDDELVEEARQNLGTKTLEDTVNAALRDLEVMERAYGQHRAAGIPDLLVAACAEIHGATVAPRGR